MIDVLFEAEARPEHQMRYLQLYVRFSTSPLPDASTPPRS
ncbi:antibiotic biosynthesis monooxygenase [Pantoea vagans]|nr:antibiotic biosynthesis monooxygenase [Pantoea vagans]